MALLVLALLGCAAGLVSGLLSGPLWLDETLSVEIARLPLPDLYAGLRQDGAPPVYYLLLKAWMALFGTGTLAVRLPSVLLTVVALVLAQRVGAQLSGSAVGGRAAVITTASLPWTMRFGSETRMYLLVVVLVLAGALALMAVHRSASRGPVLALAAVVGTLLLTHYWSLFLLASVGLLHLPGLLRRRPAAVRVAVAGVLGALVFLPWLPTFLFQAANTGAPWADPVRPVDFLLTPRYWGGGTATQRTVFALAFLSLLVLAFVRQRAARPVVSAGLLTLALAWTSVYVGGGAYAGRYTAVVVPLVAVATALGALALRGPRLPMVALTAMTLLGLGTGVPAAGQARTQAGEVADAVREAAEPGDLVVYCPDQMGPPVARLLGAGYRQVVYPSLGPPQRIDWIGYQARQDAADLASPAAEITELAGDSAVFLVTASGYRTFRGDCERLSAQLARRKGQAERVHGTIGTSDTLVWRYVAPTPTP
ncbi:MAG: hypothetical protein JWN88_506 [Frankiales bacterium]|nr:hypothetical protein [Frankiales bacterium]